MLLDAQFEDGNHRQEAHEQQEESHEHPEGADEGEALHPRRGVMAPRGWQEVLSHRGADDDETLKPHTYVYHN